MKLNLQDALAGKIDAELNVALCEWLGWTEIKKTPIKEERLKTWFDVFVGRPPYSVSNMVKLPNHINAPESLGLVHEVEGALGPKDFEAYRWILWDLCKQILVSEWNRHYLSATARQRVIAILQTVKPEIFEP